MIGPAAPPHPELRLEAPSRRGLRLDLSDPIWILVSVFLVALVALPMFWVLLMSVQTRQGEFTLANYVRVFTDRELIQPILLTMGMGLGVGVLSVLVGAPMGWLVARTDLPADRIGLGLVRDLQALGIAGALRPRRRSPRPSRPPRPGPGRRRPRHPRRRPPP